MWRKPKESTVDLWGPCCEASCNLLGCFGGLRSSFGAFWLFMRLLERLRGILGGLQLILAVSGAL